MAENKNAKTPADDGQRDKWFRPVKSVWRGGVGLTDEEIDALLPEPDGTAEEVKRKVEYRPGLWADEVGIDDAWSKSLVIEIIRAVEKHHGIGDRT